MKEVSTQVDKKIYYRVRSTKSIIDQGLTDQLVKQGVKLENVKFKYKDLTFGGCCPQMLVTAYEKPKAKTTRVKK